jgi:alpha-tubulin suppressor-like RCC1 family protein
LYSLAPRWPKAERHLWQPAAPHTIVLRNGSVITFGSNANGQLGNGSTDLICDPQVLTGFTDVSVIAAGDAHSLSVRLLAGTPTVYAWGRNHRFQLAYNRNNTVDQRLPVISKSASGGNLTGVNQLAAGAAHSIGLISGSVLAWGSDEFGQLGNSRSYGGGADNTEVPRYVKDIYGWPLTGITAIAAGGNHSLAVDTYGLVWAWGRNAAGQIGLGTATIAEPQPLRVRRNASTYLDNIEAVAAGATHSIALDWNGKVWAWGSDNRGQLGNGAAGGDVSYANKVQRRSPTGNLIDLDYIVAIAAGNNHNLAICERNGVRTLYAWGCGSSGQLGTGGTTDSEIARQVVTSDGTALTGVQAIAAGAAHSVAVLADGSIFTWGSNTAGQLGRASGQTMDVSPGIATAVHDLDQDGIPDDLESSLIGRDSTGGWFRLDGNKRDTDNNGTPDGGEDYDFDGLTIIEELSLGTNPNVADTDGDGVRDGAEIDIGANPSTPEPWATRDSDGDGLTDAFEINYGLDPNDPDTNGNGMPDGEEIDSGGDPTQPGPPPPPLPPPAPPGPEPPPGPKPTPPPPLDPGEYEVLVETKSVSFPKYGHDTFQPLTLPKRFLKMSSQQSFSGGSPESGPLGVSGSKTITINPESGETTTSGDGFVNTGGTAQSPVRRGGTETISSYDDPPNEKDDDSGTITFTTTLSSENTTEMMVTNGKKKVGAFAGEFTPGTPFAYRNVAQNELQFDYQKVQFKFKWKEGVTEEQRFAITYILLYQPEDDPKTQDDESVINAEVIGDPIKWDGQAAESSVFTIDPDEKKPGTDGKYSLVRVEIMEVSFGGDATKYHELKSDDSATTYAAPHWIDKNGDGDAADVLQGEHNYAVAFTRNTKPKIGAELEVSGLPSGIPIKVRATGPGEVRIPATSPAISGEEITLALVESSGALVNTIKHFIHKDSVKAFELKWELSFDGGTAWSEVAKTKHTIYVTFGDPKTNLRQETLFDLGCRNADGETDEGNARDRMFSEFTDRNVKRLDGTQMTYWSNGQMGSTDTPALLSRPDGNGNCQSWSGLFRDVLLIQGIQADRIRVWPQAHDTSVIVKSWRFTEPPHGPPNHPYVIGLDATDAQGIAGQGNPDPPGSFNGHWITDSGGAYYDPSYGTTPVSGSNRGKLYEDGAFEGFGATYVLPDNTRFDAIRKNDTSSQSPSEVDYIEDN